MWWGNIYVYVNYYNNIVFLEKCDVLNWNMNKRVVY